MKAESILTAPDEAVSQAASSPPTSFPRLDQHVWSAPFSAAGTVAKSCKGSGGRSEGIAQYMYTTGGSCA